MTTFDKLKARIKKDLDIEVTNFRRNRVGYWQRSAGAWLWVGQRVAEDGRVTAIDVGSTYRAADLVRSGGKLQITRGWEIFPDDSFLLTTK
jgi:hypothetical protein